MKIGSQVFVGTEGKVDLRVDTKILEFRQIPRGRGFILLGFYTLFKCFIMFQLD